MLSKNDKKNEDNKNLGVLYTGYLEKKNPVTGSFKRRFVVLTHDALHWFKRSEGYDLFGEERGHVGLINILTTRVLDEDNTVFELQWTDGRKKLFRAGTPTMCEEWVSAIRSTIKSHAKRPNTHRRQSISNIRGGNVVDNNENHNELDYDPQDVSVLLVSQCSSSNSQTEVVLARNPAWDRVVTVPCMKKGDHLILSLSNGGNVTLTYDLIFSKAEDEQQFDIAVQNVPLASSLRLSVDMRSNDKSAAEVAAAKRNQQKQSTFAKYSERLVEVANAMSTNQNCATNVVLSVMVMMAGVSSLRALGTNALLLFLFATVLSLYNIYTTIDCLLAEIDGTSASKGSVVKLKVHGHAFTSPDAPVTDSDNDIPQRFIDGCEGDMKEARRRWDITKHWRESEGVNSILEEQQPYFFLIKQMYPHYYAGRGKQGHIVYYERPGEFEGAQLAARGVTTDHLVRHWLFSTEYQWQVLCGGDETAKSIAVLDISTVKLTDLAGDNLNFLKKTLAIANQHYPERSFAILIINAPFFFSMGWKMVKPMVHENTQKKVRILSSKETLQGLQEYMDISQIPECYGGQLDFGGKDSCRFNSPETKDLNEWVKRVNEGGAGGGGNAGITQNKVPFKDGELATSSNDLPPGNPGDIPDTAKTGQYGPAGPSVVTPRRQSNLKPRRSLFSSNSSQDLHLDRRGHDSPGRDDWSEVSATTNGEQKTINRK